jgi:hypothetical protein
VLDECFADLLKGLVFDDQVMHWIVDALHQSHADEKRFREDAVTRLQEEQTKIQNRLDRLYDDRLDGFIEPDFFERKSREWRQTQKGLADQITNTRRPHMIKDHTLTATLMQVAPQSLGGASSNC